MPKQESYLKAKQAYQSKPFGTNLYETNVFEKNPVKSFGIKAGNSIDYEVGDRVKHMKFGEGLVTNIVEGGRDYEVTVQFDNVGTKKMLASFAKLQKIE